MYFLNLFILFLHIYIYIYIYICFLLVAFVREHMRHKAFLMGYLMRLELTLVSSMNDLLLVQLVYIEIVVPLSWSGFTLYIIYIYLYISWICNIYTGHWHNGLSVRQWPGRPGFNPRSIHTKDFEMVLDASLLNTQHFKVRMKRKVS